MKLPNGIPTIADLDALLASEVFKQHADYNAHFLDEHANAMKSYGGKWALDQLRLWSRRWEYPFVAQRLLDFAKAKETNELRFLDAGSGVTYFPYFVVDQLIGAEVVCCDYDESYAPQFDRINRECGHTKVSFVPGTLQKIPLPDESVDALCCVSVMEHTDDHATIVKEFARVLKPGGLFVLTFDLSLDDKFTLPKPQARTMLEAIGKRFRYPDGFDIQKELDRTGEQGILSSDHVRATEPDRLPWTWPVRVYKAAGDLLAGRGWTAGFRSRTVYCVDVVKK